MKLAQFWTLGGTNCSALNVGTQKDKMDIIQNGIIYFMLIGSLLANYTKPSNTSDDFAYYFKTAHDTPFFFPFLRFSPGQGIRIRDFRHQVFNINESLYVFNSSCNPHVSYQFTVDFVFKSRWN